MGVGKNLQHQHFGVFHRNVTFAKKGGKDKNPGLIIKTDAHKTESQFIKERGTPVFTETQAVFN